MAVVKDMEPSGTKKEKTKAEENPLLKWLKEFVFKFFRKLHDPKFVVEILALIGLGFYVCETHRTNNLTQLALETSKDQFRIDQRPYVWITNELSPFVQAPHGPGNTSDKLAFSFKFTNYGKSPAIHCQVDARIAIGKDGYREIVWKVMDASKGSILPPGRVDFNTAYSDETVSPDFLKQVVSPGVMEPIEVVGRIQYFGTDGTPYSSDFCLGRNPAQSLYYCPHHNEIK
jgi:hypothetical protein